MIRNLGQVAAIYIGSSAPRNTNLIWLDNTVVPFVFRAYDGSAWSEIATHKWVRAYVDGWLVTLPPRQLADDGDYMLINSNNVNYKITVKDFVKSAVGNPLDFKGVIRVSADFPNPSTLESGDMYVIITSPAGGTVTDPYSGKTFEDSEKIVWDEVTQSWESLGKIDITVDLTTSYSETEVTIHSSAGKETTIQGATDQLAGVMLPGQYSWLQALSNGSIVPGDPSPLTPLTPAHKHNYSDIVNRLVSQQGTGESTIDPMSQKATTDALNLKFDKASVLQVSGAATDKVMSQKAVTDALKTLSDDFNNKLTNYLPLAGGTMKGNIVFNNNLFLNWKDTKGSTYQVLSMKSNDEINIGNAAFPLNLYSKEDLFHKRNGENVYRIYDAYNLPDPATLSGNNVFTGNNTFQAGKFNVGSFEVISNGGLLINVSTPAGSGWARSLTFKANSDNTSKLIFGGDNSVNDTSAGYAYIGIGDVNSSTAQYKFYANSLRVPYQWSIDGPDGSAILWSQTSEIVNLGRAAGTTKIRSGNTDLIHTKGSTEYIIWDKSNLPNPVRYALDASNYPTLLDSNGSSFSYIKAGTNGLLPHSQVTLANGGSGSLGTSDQSFNAAYINHLYTNKISFGVNGPYIIGSTSATQFLDANGGVQKVATGGLYVGVSYASDALNLVPANGIYSSGVIKGAVGFSSNFRQVNLNLASTAAYSLYISSFIEGSTSAPGADPISGRTVNDGVLLTYFWGGDFAFQLAGDIDGSGIAYRSYAPSTGVSSLGWRFLADTSWVVSKINSSTSNYLPLTGGTLSGNLTINTVGSTTLVINNNDTNGSETFMRVLRKGTASAAIGFRDSLGAYIYNYNSNKYLFIDNDGYARVGTTSGSTRLALITDIPTVSGYLPLTGGTLTGTLSINSGGSEPLIINNSASAGEAYVVTKTQGTTRGVMGWNSSLGMFLQDNRGYTFSVKADGVYFGASSSTLTKLPTSTDLSNYLPLTGGNLTGKLSIKSSGSNLLILDSSSSTESVIHFLRSSTTKGAVGYYDNIGAFIYNFPSNTYLFVKDDGKPYVGTKTNYKKILTETDITGYATQSWVNNQGYLTSHQTIYNLTFQAGTFAAKTFDPNGAAATVNIPTNTSHLTNDSGFITSSALNGYATQAWVNSQNFVKSTSTKKVTDIQPVDALPATQVSGVLYLVFG